MSTAPVPELAGSSLASALSNECTKSQLSISNDVPGYWIRYRFSAGLVAWQ